jgi:hypothetical protein
MLGFFVFGIPVRNWKTIQPTIKYCKLCCVNSELFRINVINLA